ncbi:unnamed protein product [Fusarium graminearum]|nr:unnamed protein product [Fusarium graminearum]
MCFRTHTSIDCPVCGNSKHIINLTKTCTLIPRGGGLGSCGFEIEDLYFIAYGSECDECRRKREEEEEEEEERKKRRGQT